MPKQLLILLLTLLLTSCSQSDEILSEGYYGKENGKWVWYGAWDAGNQERRTTPIEDVEGELTIIEPRRYAKTSENVYLYGLKIHGADPSTFTTLEFPFSKDKNHIYCGTLYLLGVDVENFRIIPENIKWIYVKGRFNEIEKTDYGPHPEIEIGDWVSCFSAVSTDGKKVFYGHGEIKGADPKTFETLGMGHYQDKLNVYCGINKLEGVDRETLIIYGFAAEDKNSRFEYGKRVGPPLLNGAKPAKTPNY